ncbi:MULTISPECIES: 2'-5' RNA ligase family protein [Flavobacterium]|uniref:2'-5' RNA ligase family protein n=1 Tax=Flavobacterium TaxID=237 RepID=UPI001FCA976E|nr:MULTISPECIES: 2'-5' RNA ligase family protein [Flavobacterium]UOK41476.1 2'-5' RNA ligase family protein [Flavobacterium enshiense]
MEGHYSVAIIPSEQVIALVKTMKLELADKVGWFNSKNSMGHITINEFKASDAVIEKVKQQLTRLCDGFKPVEVHLTGFGSYPNGAFFIDPDEDTKNKLKPIMKQINDTLIIKDLHISNDPHLSIARRLSREKLGIAKSYFTTIDERFLCSSVVLRTFDENVKQYYISDIFPFRSNPTEVQGTLF